MFRIKFKFEWRCETWKNWRCENRCEIETTSIQNDIPNHVMPGIQNSSHFLRVKTFVSQQFRSTHLFDKILRMPYWYWNISNKLHQFMHPPLVPHISKWFADHCFVQRISGKIIRSSRDSDDLGKLHIPIKLWSMCGMYRVHWYIGWYPILELRLTSPWQICQMRFQIIPALKLTTFHLFSWLISVPIEDRWIPTIWNLVVPATQVQMSWKAIPTASLPERRV